MIRHKVFGIGFHRTGTTSLQSALEALGYAVTGMTGADWNAFDQGDTAALAATIERYDGFRDMPWPLLYRWLDEAYPQARFVLTVRDADAWAASCVGNYKAKPYAMFPRIYGFDSFVGNEARAIEVHDAHVAGVRAHFAGRPGKLLEVDLTAGMVWPRLCDFLDEPVPRQHFPHANKRPRGLPRRAWYYILRTHFPQHYLRMVRDKVE